MSKSNRPIVVLTDDTIHPAGPELLAQTCDVRILPGSYPSEAVLSEAARDAVAIFARMGAVTRGVIDAAPNLKIIARHGIGVDAVDMQAATGRGVIVTTTGAINAGAVAEYAYSILLGFARKLAQADNGMRSGQWSRENQVGAEMAEKTIGIIGLGAIGSHMARISNGFGMKIIAHDPVATPPADLDIEMVSREELYRRADVVSLHMRLTPETRHTVDAAGFAAMKPEAIFVNTARGELVDEAALIDALASGSIAGAALDVFEQEPLPENSPLRSMDNVFLSPHVAGQTAESMRKVALAAAENILAEIDGRSPPFIYNPEALEIRKALTGG